MFNLVFKDGFIFYQKELIFRPLNGDQLKIKIVIVVSDKTEFLNFGKYFTTLSLPPFSGKPFLKIISLKNMNHSMLLF